MNLDPKLTRLYTDIAQALGVALDGQMWRFRPEDRDNQEYGSHLLGPDGADISLGEYKGRIEIRGWYPRTDTHPKYHTISASAAKPASTIARDIARRLLPDYLPELERVKQWNRAQADATVQRHAFMGGIAAMFGDDADGSKYERSTDRAQYWNHQLGAATVTVEVNGAPDTVKVEFASLPPELAVRVLDIVAAELFNARDEAGRAQAREWAKTL